MSNQDPDTKEFDDEFKRIYKKLHGEDAQDFTMIRFHKGMRDVFGALAGTEANISIWETVTEAERYRTYARVLLRALDRRTDKAWAFNLGWRKAATFAEKLLAGDIANPKGNERFTQLMMFARLSDDKPVSPPLDTEEA